MGKLSKDDERTIEAIVNNGAALMDTRQDIAGGDHEKDATDREERDVQTDNVYGVPADADAQSSAKVLKEVMEQVAESTDVEQAIAAGIEITADLLMKVNGDLDTPETTADI